MSFNFISRTYSITPFSLFLGSSVLEPGSSAYWGRSKLFSLTFLKEHVMFFLRAQSVTVRFFRITEELGFRYSASFVDAIMTKLFCGSVLVLLIFNGILVSLERNSLTKRDFLQNWSTFCASCSDINYISWSCFDFGFWGCMRHGALVRRVSKLESWRGRTRIQHKVARALMTLEVAQVVGGLLKFIFLKL